MVKLTAPAVFQKESQPAFETVFIDRVGRVNEEKENIVEKTLESRYAVVVLYQERSERVGACNAQGQDLTACKMSVF